MNSNFEVDPQFPDRRIIDRAAEIIRNGGVVIFPTRCLYGLGADPFNERAAARLFQIKGRPENKPILSLIHDLAQLNLFTDRISPIAEKIIRVFWPGRVTLVFRAAAGLSPLLTAGSDGIGIRQCAHPVARLLIQSAGRPITGTSANYSGEPGVSAVSDLSPQFLQQSDFVLNAGRLAGGVGSTVVDVRGDAPVILREGVVSAREILAAVATG